MEGLWQNRFNCPKIFWDNLSCSKIGYFNVGQKLPEKLPENDVPFNHTLDSTILFSAAPYIRTKISYHHHRTRLT
jgi:hypothetical protein